MTSTCCKGMKRAMKRTNQLFLVALLVGAVQTSFAQAAGGQNDSMARLMQAVRASQGAESSEINPQVTSEEAAASGTTTATATNDEKVSELAKLVQQQQQRSAQSIQQSTDARKTKLAAARAQAAAQKPTVHQEAFVDMTGSTMPLSPDQIRSLKKMFNQSQRAAAEHPDVPPRPTSTSVTLDLSPGATPPIIRLSAGFVTSLVFVDATGAPWPIAAYDLGDPRSYNIQWDKKGNTLMLQAITSYKTGNLAVILKGMHTPVMLTLLPGQRAVDYRVDLRMPNLGPNAETFVTNLPSTENSVVMSVLNGVPPNGAKKLTIHGGDAEGWMVGSNLYLRTRLTVISPGWMATMSSADGLHAYELQQTPVILASFHGKLIKLTVEGL